MVIFRYNQIMANWNTPSEHQPFYFHILESNYVIFENFYSIFWFIRNRWEDFVIYTEYFEEC